MSDNPAPGWYADPLRRYDHRYWDGTDWTEHVSRAGVQETDPLDGTGTAAGTAAGTGTAAQPPGTGDAAAGRADTAEAGWPSGTAPAGAWSPEATGQRPTGTTVNALAIVSLVLSLIWVGGLASLAAIITGVIARRQIRDSQGRETGDGAALAGIIIGGIGVALTLLAIFAMAAFMSIPTTPDWAR